MQRRAGFFNYTFQHLVADGKRLEVRWREVNRIFEEDSRPAVRKGTGESAQFT